MNIDIILGKTTEHLVQLEGTKCFIHKQMLQDFLALQKASRDAGFDLQVISGFRDYDRQLTIWNAKAIGERPLYDKNGVLLKYSQLSPVEIMWAILQWSALPGASRHHWGTDIDVYDGKTQRPAEVKLIPDECENGGPSAALHEWLDSLIFQKSSWGFYRPYQTDTGGVSPERWHLSYAPLSSRINEMYTYSIFKRSLEESPILLKEVVLEHAAEIFERFVQNVDLP